MKSAQNSIATDKRKMGTIYVTDDTITKGEDSSEGLQGYHNGIHLAGINYQPLSPDAVVQAEFVVDPKKHINQKFSGVWFSGHPQLAGSIEAHALAYFRNEEESKGPDAVYMEIAAAQRMEGYFIVDDNYKDKEDKEEPDEEACGDMVSANASGCMLLSEGYTLDIDLSRVVLTMDPTAFVKIIAYRAEKDDDDCPELYSQYEGDDDFNFLSFAKNKEAADFESVFYLKAEDILNSPTSGSRIMVSIFAFKSIDYGYFY